MVRLADTPSVKESLQLLLQDMNGRIGMHNKNLFCLLGQKRCQYEIYSFMNRSLSGHPNECYSPRRIVVIHLFIYSPSIIHV